MRGKDVYLAPSDVGLECHESVVTSHVRLCTTLYFPDLDLGGGPGAPTSRLTQQMRYNHSAISRFIVKKLTRPGVVEVLGDGAEGTRVRKDPWLAIIFGLLACRPRPR